MSKDLFVNEQIRSPLVVLIDAEGKNRGQFSKLMAIQLARTDGLDLVQVSPSNPPVCKIADYGKMRFEASKSEKQAHHAPAIKEIRFGIDIAQHDLEVKLRKVRECLHKGHRVQLSAELVGRQKYAQNLRQNGRVRLTEVLASLADCGVATPPKDGEKLITTMLTPIA